MCWRWTSYRYCCGNRPDATPGVVRRAPTFLAMMVRAQRAVDLLAKSPGGLAAHFPAGNWAGIDNPEPNIANGRFPEHPTATRIAQAALAPEWFRQRYPYPLSSARQALEKRRHVLA